MGELIHLIVSGTATGAIYALAALGFTLSFFDSDPAFNALSPGLGGFSSLLSNGLTVTGVDNGVPEPLTLSLFSAGLVGAAVPRLRQIPRCSILGELGALDQQGRPSFMAQT